MGTTRPFRVGAAVLAAVNVLVGVVAVAADRPAEELTTQAPTSTSSRSTDDDAGAATALTLPPVSLPPISLPPISLPPISLPPISLPPITLDPWPPPVAEVPFLPITPLSYWRPPFDRLPLLPTDYVYIEADAPETIEFQPSMTYTRADTDITMDMGESMSFGLNILHPLPAGGENFSAVWLSLPDGAPLTTGMHRLDLPRWHSGSVGMSYIGSVNCNFAESELIVDLAVHDAQGLPQLVQFRFEQVCDTGQVVRGEVRWTAP